jgi:hypothetical protein
MHASRVGPLFMGGTRHTRRRTAEAAAARTCALVAHDWRVGPGNGGKKSLREQLGMLQLGWSVVQKKCTVLMSVRRLAQRQRPARENGSSGMVIAWSLAVGRWGKRHGGKRVCNSNGGFQVVTQPAREAQGSRSRTGVVRRTAVLFLMRSEKQLEAFGKGAGKERRRKGGKLWAKCVV